MKTFTLYGKEYTGAPIGYRELCDMERKFHINISEIGDLQLNSIAAYIGISCRDIADPYLAAEDYIIEHGDFADIIEAMSEAMNESRFFTAIQAQMEEAQTEEKAPAKKTRAKKNTEG